MPATTASVRDLLPTPCSGSYPPPCSSLPDVTSSATRARSLHSACHNASNESNFLEPYIFSSQWQDSPLPLAMPYASPRNSSVIGRSCRRCAFSLCIIPFHRLKCSPQSRRLAIEGRIHTFSRCSMPKSASNCNKEGREQRENAVRR